MEADGRQTDRHLAIAIFSSECAKNTLTFLSYVSYSKNTFFISLSVTFIKANKHILFIYHVEQETYSKRVYLSVWSFYFNSTFLEQITLNKKQNNCGCHLTQTDFINNIFYKPLERMMLLEEIHTQN